MSTKALPIILSMQVDELEKAPYPPEFVTSILENAQAALNKYLIKSNAPQEVIDLLGSLVYLNYYISTYGRAEQIPAIDCDFIQSAVSEASWAIVKIGQPFYSPSGEIFPNAALA